MNYINQYIDENKERFLEELFGLIRIPSISSLSENKADMLKAAEYWKNSMLKAGADKAEIMPINTSNNEGLSFFFPAFLHNDEPRSDTLMRISAFNPLML